MSEFEQYQIGLINLKNKDYSYEFEVDSSFFENFEQQLLENGNLKVNLLLRKSETMIQLFFHIQGTIELLCDRSLEKFDFPIDVEEKMILKFGETNEQITEELEVISRNTVRIDIAQYIYEYIGLAIPMKKIHPKFQEEDDFEGEAESLLIYSSEDEDSSEEKEQEEKEIDPRWQILKKLKN